MRTENNILLIIWEYSKEHNHILYPHQRRLCGFYRWENRLSEYTQLGDHHIVNSRTRFGTLAFLNTKSTMLWRTIYRKSGT